MVRISYTCPLDINPNLRFFLLWLVFLEVVMVFAFIIIFVLSFPLFRLLVLKK